MNIFSLLVEQEDPRYSYTALELLALLLDDGTCRPLLGPYVEKVCTCTYRSWIAHASSLAAAATSAVAASSVAAAPSALLVETEWTAPFACRLLCKCKDCICTLFF